LKDQGCCLALLCTCSRTWCIPDAGSRARCVRYFDVCATARVILPAVGVCALAVEVDVRVVGARLANPLLTFVDEPAAAPLPVCL
jgi:hypothetical protein